MYLNREAQENRSHNDFREPFMSFSICLLIKKKMSPFAIPIKQ